MCGAIGHASAHPYPQRCGEVDAAVNAAQPAASRLPDGPPGLTHWPLIPPEREPLCCQRSMYRNGPLMTGLAPAQKLTTRSPFPKHGAWQHSESGLQLCVPWAGCQLRSGRDGASRITVMLFVLPTSPRHTMKEFSGATRRTSCPASSMRAVMHPKPPMPIRIPHPLALDTLEDPDEPQQECGSAAECLKKQCAAAGAKSS